MLNIEKEFKKFIKDIEKNIKNEDDLKFIQKRTAELFESILDELEEAVDLREKLIEDLVVRQEELEDKMQEIQKTINNIEKDIYLEDEFDFEIVCPYCNNEFLIDVDENKTEVVCPECKNVIELDWSGNVEDEFGCTPEDCSACPGCASKKEVEDEDDDM